MKLLANRRMGIGLAATAAFAIGVLYTVWPEASDRGLAAQTPPQVTRPAPDSVANRQGGETKAAPTKNPEKKPVDVRPVRPPRKDGDVLVCTFDHIKFDMEKNAEFKREMITKDIEALAGKKIRITGYILPTFQSKLKFFVLVRDNMECCFGPGAMLFDCVIVQMKNGATAEYTTRPVSVEGVFGIDVRTDLDDRIESIYVMEGESVR